MKIKAKLYLLLAIIIAGFTCVFVVSSIGNDIEENLVELDRLALRSVSEVLQARRQEKNFTTRKDAAYRAKVAEHIKAAGDNVRTMAELDPGQADKLARNGQALAAYLDAFDAYAQNAEDSGLTGLDGLSGKMVQAGRDLEKLAKSLDDAVPLVIILQLRRQEKNYQMRGGAEYLDRVRSHLNDIIAWARDNNEQRLSELSARYAGIFDAYVARQDKADKLMQAVVATGRAVEPQIMDLSEYYQEIYQSTSDRIRLALAGVEAGILAVVVLLILWIIRNITAPLSALQHYSRAVAQGDLKARPKGSFTGEFLQLKADLALMIGNLEQTIDQVRVKEQEAQGQARAAEKASAEAQAQAETVRELLKRNQAMAEQAESISERLSSAASQLSAQSEQVAKGAEVQKDRMAQTAVAMEQMNATVMEIARNAGGAAEVAHRTRENAQSGTKVVGEVADAMARVNDLSLRLKQDMQSLGQDADSVGQVINVINEIADQTNLLALNAAIEAARAGDAGRGFAVVADEVRKLAEKTMDATQEVESRILAIQNAAKRNTGLMDEATQAVSHADDLARQSGRALEEILGMADDTAGQVQSIAAASEEQSAASEEIGRAVEEVNTIASESVQGMNESVEAVVGLAGMASELRGIIQALQDGSA